MRSKSQERFSSIIFFGLLLVVMMTLSGCVVYPGEETRASLLPISSIVEDVLHGSYGEAQPEAQYQKEPPCNHGGEEKHWKTDKDRCTRKNPAHVAYWTSREDRYRLACRGQHPSYCDDRSFSDGGTGMMPHCHGYGKFRYCHAHPGGDSPHDHIHDFEFAANASPNWP